MAPPESVVMLLILWSTVTCLGLALAEIVYRIIKWILGGK